MAAISTARFSAKPVRARLQEVDARISAAREESDVDAVHDLRISIRRLEPLLDVFQPCFSAKRVKKVRQHLHGVLALAGQVRNCDTALKLVATLHTKGIGDLRAKLHAQREEAAASLRSALGAEWDPELPVAHPRRKFCRQPARTTAREEIASLAKDFFRFGDRAAASSRTSARELHQLRIAAKHFRYTLELFAPLLGRPVRIMLSKIREVQHLLGSVSNHRAARDSFSGLDGARKVENYLKKEQHKRVKRFRQEWKHQFSGALVKQWIQAIRKDE